MENHVECFRRLHRDGLFLLPNAWDAMSARQMQQAGFAAIGTSSAAVAWCLGYGDGEVMPFGELHFITGRILTAVDVPLTVDMEAGFGTTAEAIAANAVALARLGVAGINLEDSLKDREDALRPLEDQVAIIRVIRDALQAEGLDLFINARTDLFWMGLESEADRLPATIARCRAFAAAGADGVFVPGLTDFAAIADLAASVDCPLNILAFPGKTPGGLLPDLAKAGVARVSVGSGAYRRVAADVAALARSLRAETNLDHLFDQPLPYDALQAMALGAQS